MRWLIESEVFGDEAAGLIQALQARGHSLTRWDEDLLDRRRAPWPAGERALFHGSLGTAQQLRQRPWAPRIYCDVPALHCSAYYPRYQEFLLNQRYRVVPARELVARREQVHDELGSPERLFLRPDSPLKEFAGRVLDPEQLTLTALDHGFYYDDDQLPVLVAPAVQPGREWRFVVAGDQPVAWSGYAAEGRRREQGEPAPEVLTLARRIASEVPGPEPLYVLDLVETEQGPRLLELNSFSCSDLYGCDPAAVAMAAELLA